VVPANLDDIDNVRDAAIEGGRDGIEPRAPVVQQGTAPGE
jgi:hypothetical protein